jgi:hypothetical protein
LSPVADSRISYLNGFGERQTAVSQVQTEQLSVTNSKEPIVRDAEE